MNFSGEGIIINSVKLSLTLFGFRANACGGQQADPKKRGLQKKRFITEQAFPLRVRVSGGDLCRRQKHRPSRQARQVARASESDEVESQKKDVVFF